MLNRSRKFCAIHAMARPTCATCPRLAVMWRIREPSGPASRRYRISCSASGPSRGMAAGSSSKRTRRRAASRRLASAGQTVLPIGADGANRWQSRSALVVGYGSWNSDRCIPVFSDSLVLGFSLLKSLLSTRRNASRPWNCEWTACPRPMLRGDQHYERTFVCE